MDNNLYSFIEKNFNKEQPNIQEIEQFIETYCTEVYEMPDHALDLIMDDHKCILYRAKEYFLPEINMFGKEEIIYYHLIKKYSI